MYCGTRNSTHLVFAKEGLDAIDLHNTYLVAEAGFEPAIRLVMSQVP